MTSTQAMDDKEVIRETVMAASPGSVVVLAAMDHAALFEGLSAVTRRSGDPITLLSIDDGLDYLLERGGCPFVSLRRLLPFNAYAGIDRLAEDVAGRWNLLDGQDITEFEAWYKRDGFILHGGSLSESQGSPCQAHSSIRSPALLRTATETSLPGCFAEDQRDSLVRGRLAR